MTEYVFSVAVTKRYPKYPDISTTQMASESVANFEEVVVSDPEIVATTLEGIARAVRGRSEPVREITAGQIYTGGGIRGV